MIINQQISCMLSSTTGTANVLQLISPVLGAVTFADALPDNVTILYQIRDGNQFEIGTGTYANSTLSRDTVSSSSNGNQKISLSGFGSIFALQQIDTAPDQSYVRYNVNNQNLTTTEKNNALTNLGFSTYSETFPPLTTAAEYRSNLGIAFANTSQAQAGTDNTTYMTPALVSSAISSLTSPVSDRVTNVRLVYYGFTQSTASASEVAGTVTSAVGNYQIPSTVTYAANSHRRYLQIYTPAAGWVTVSYA